jgi:hypothetical protein
MAAPRSRRLWIAGAAAGAAGLLLFALFSARGGGFTYFATGASTPCLYVPPGAEHRAKANCSGIGTAGSASAPIAFNSAGLRDREYSPRAPLGTLRILVLGSSTALGLGIPEALTFPRLLEKNLRAAGRKVEVINAAMTGYCTTQAAFRLKELLTLYQPKLVLYNFLQGSCPLFDGAWSGRVVFEQDRPSRIDRAPFRGFASSLNHWIFPRPGLFFPWLTFHDQWLKIRFSRSVASLDTEGERLRAWLAPTITVLRYMKEESDRAGAKFATVSFNMKPLIQSVPSHFHQGIARLLSPFVVLPQFEEEAPFPLLREEGFTVIRLRVSSRGANAIEGDEHLNERGHELLAELTAAALLPLLR